MSYIQELHDEVFDLKLEVAGLRLKLVGLRPPDDVLRLIADLLPQKYSERPNEFSDAGWTRVEYNEALSATWEWLSRAKGEDDEG